MSNNSSTRQVVHFDFIALATDASEEAVEDLIQEAAGLHRMNSVQAVGVIRGTTGSDFDLAFFFVLDGFTSLEPFGTDPAYIRFLQGKVARLLRGFAGADIILRAPFPAPAAFAACLALAAPDETYDWEVSSALEQAIDGGSSVIGLAVGERQRYRGCVLTFSDTPVSATKPADQRFEVSLIAGPVRSL